MSKLTTSEFTQPELNTVALFFGHSYSPELYELSESFVLESGYIESPIGDRLEVVTNGIIVSFAGSESEPFLFQRDFGGLVSALERLSESVA